MKTVILKTVFLILFVNDILPLKETFKKRCMDKHSTCSELAKKGHCKEIGIRKKCPKSCEICSQGYDDLMVKDLLNTSENSKKTLIAVLIMVLCGIVIGIIKVYNSGGMCHSKGTLNGKTVVLTGGTSGIGYETAFNMMVRGAHVIVGCHNICNGVKIAAKLCKESRKNTVEVKKLDLSDLESVEDFAEDVLKEHEKIDILINNAATITKKHRITRDEIEKTFQVNYVSHFLLTQLLLDRLKTTKRSRILNIVGNSYHKGKIDFNDLFLKQEFDNIRAYNNSKLALMLFTEELSRKLKGSGVTVNAINPGTTITNLYRNVFPYNWKILWFFIYPYAYLFWKTASQGAESTYYGALENDLENVSGKYIEDCRVKQTCVQNKKIARKLWEVTESLIDNVSDTYEEVIHSAMCSKSPRQNGVILEEDELEPKNELQKKLE